MSFDIKNIEQENIDIKKIIPIVILFVFSIVGSMVFVYYYFHDLFFYFFKKNIFRFISIFSITYGIVALFTPPFYHTNPLFVKSWVVINIFIFALFFLLFLRVIFTIF